MLLGAGIPEIFPEMGKIILFVVSVLELHIFRSKGMTLGSAQFFCFTSHYHQTLSPALGRLITLFISLFKIVSKGRLFYH